MAEAFFVDAEGGDGARVFQEDQEAVFFAQELGADGGQDVWGDADLSGIFLEDLVGEGGGEVGVGDDLGDFCGSGDGLTGVLEVDEVANGNIGRCFSPRGAAGEVPAGFDGFLGGEDLGDEFPAGGHDGEVVHGVGKVGG